MWWLDPGKDILNALFNRILAPYVENLDMEQVTYGIGEGQLTLGQLRLKRGVLDKFQLPVEIIEGHLGTFTLSLHWKNLGNQPVNVLIEDVYILVGPSSMPIMDPKAEEQKAQAAKAERLRNADLLQVRGQPVQSTEATPQSQGLWASLIAKIINNLQVTVKNIHVRYEDYSSVTARNPFAAGLTLAGFSVSSVDDNWEPAFIDSTAGVIHKLANLQSLALYFDTDGLDKASTSVQGIQTTSFSRKSLSRHQFILKPVSGEGRIILTRNEERNIPRFDVRLLFDEIGVTLDDEQYRIAVALVDTCQFYFRRRQHRQFWPSGEELNRPRALLRFAMRTVLHSIHEKRRRWSWDFFVERRDDRKQYTELFEKKLRNNITQFDSNCLDALETKLSYEDIVFYRSLVRARLRKDVAIRKKAEEDKRKQQDTTQSWTSWLWSSYQTGHQAGLPPGGVMTHEQRQQLYDVLDFDEESALSDSYQHSRHTAKIRVTVKLKTGSFALKKDPRGSSHEFISISFDAFRADFIQRFDNYEASLSLGGFKISDDTTKGTLYRQIVHVDNAPRSLFSSLEEPRKPFFFIKFENNPLDKRADTALTVRLQHMEIVYHRAYVEAVWQFFRPPQSQLESVEALLNVASQKFEGLRRETKAGLSTAIQAHKTIHLEVNVDTPMIIIPENVTTTNCQFFVVDAGHISILSDPANKSRIHGVDSSCPNRSSEDEHRHLESLLYDKTALRLEAAQFVLGPDLPSCREALASGLGSQLHILERTNIDLLILNSITLHSLELVHFKVSGRLPTLQVNLSDAKYQSILRILNLCFPNFDDRLGNEEFQRKQSSATFRGSSCLFGQVENDFDIMGESSNVESSTRQTPPLQPGDRIIKHVEVRQATFEFNFKVDRLCTVLKRSSDGGHEKLLGQLYLEHFTFSFSTSNFDTVVNICLRSLVMNLVQAGLDPLQFISSQNLDTPVHEDLLKISYIRSTRRSSQFSGAYENMYQDVDIIVSTFAFKVAPEPVLSLYDFIMAGFVSASGSRGVHNASIANELDAHAREETSHFGAQMAKNHRISLTFASLRIVLVSETDTLATLSLSTADVNILTRANTLSLVGRLGCLALEDNRMTEVARPEFKQLMSIQSEQFAEIRYQTVDPTQDTYAGINSSIHISAGSVKVHFLEQPILDIGRFITKLVGLKVLYDTARQAAAQKALELEHIQFEISIQSPIVVFPLEPARVGDAFVVRLGEVSAQNSCHDQMNKIAASLRGIQLVSDFDHDGCPSSIKMIDDIDISSVVLQRKNTADRGGDTACPNFEVAVEVSDVELSLAQVEYRSLIRLMQSVVTVLTNTPQDGVKPISVMPNIDDRSLTSYAGQHHLEPELHGIHAPKVLQKWTIIDSVITINSVSLHLSNRRVTSNHSLKHHRVARFTLKNNTVRFKLVSNSAVEVQVVCKDFTLNNTMVEGTKFRSIVSAARHGRDQLALMYTKPSRSSASLAVITIDSPQIIFAQDLFLALLEFFNISSPRLKVPATRSHLSNVMVERPLEFRIDLHDVSITFLENHQDHSSQAVKLNISRISLSRQGVLALTMKKLGVSLVQMDDGEDVVHILDDVNISLSYQSRISRQRQTSSADLAVNPIIIRVSFRDVILINAIITKAMSRYKEMKHSSLTGNDMENPMHETIDGRTGTPFGLNDTNPVVIGKAGTMFKEQLQMSFDTIRVILTGDMQEEPMLHLKIKPFMFGIKDWSSQRLQVTTTIVPEINYWNLTNSHWEPLIDPWALAILVNYPDMLSRIKCDPNKITIDGTFGGLNVCVSARERLDVNITSTFVDLAVTNLRIWSQEGEQVSQQTRGSRTPYCIRNRTGFPILVWSDNDNSKDLEAVTVANDETVHWRFDDRKTMLEHALSSGHQTQNIGVRFVGKSWESVHGVPVNREGSFTFLLRPRMGNYADSLLCAVKVHNNVKVVTFRSTYLVENQTFYPLEVMLVDHAGQPVHSLKKIAPGRDYPLPIDTIAQNRIRLQPDQGFGYRWSPSIRLEDLFFKKSFTVGCPHHDGQEAPFRFQAWVEGDTQVSGTRNSLMASLKLKLRAPIELENLLPYDFRYRIYDKNTDQNWTSYLRRGGIMPVHSVELGHLILLNIDIQDTVFNPSEFSVINTDRHSDFDVESFLTLRDQCDRKLQLQLNYVRYPDSGGAFKVQIYSAYVLVNKTNLPFGVKFARFGKLPNWQDVAGDSRQDTLSRSIPFMLSHPLDRSQTFAFKIGDSGWSNVFSLDAPAAETELVMPSEKQKSEVFHFGLSWTEGLGKYKLTKVITLLPRFIVINNLDGPICLREHGADPKGRAIIVAGDRLPLHVMQANRGMLLTIAFPGLNSQWSPPINIENIGPVHFRLQSSMADRILEIMKADVRIKGSTIFITYSRAQEWPFIIENYSDYSISLWQMDQSQSRSESSCKSGVSYMLEPNTSLEYAWDYPASCGKRIVLSINDARHTVDIMEIGVLLPFRFSDRQRLKAVSLDVRADGDKQILRVTNYMAEYSLYKPKSPADGSMSPSCASTSNIEPFEAVAEEIPPSLTLAIDLAGIGLSMINRKVIEVLYITMHKLKFEYSNSRVLQAINLSCRDIQVDNQLHDALYPVVLQPSPVAKETGALLPTIQGSVIWLKDREHGVLFIKYCSILIQAVTIEADEDLLFAILDLAQVNEVSWEEETEDVLIADTGYLPEPQETQSGQYLYFEILELQPVQLSLSFMRTERINSREKLRIRNPLAVMMNALTMALGNINDAPLELNALVIRDMRLTLPELQGRITYHYRQDVLRQFYRILGSADFIGNPVGLFTNVSSGVADIFYAPYHGIVLHGNKEFGIGIAKVGAASFVKKTVFGLSDSITKFTSSMGKGLSAATFDSEYQARRRTTQRRNKPRHAIYGVTAGGEALASSIMSAMEGIVTKPVQGAESEGALGFFKGVGKGIVGVVTKPAVGVFDLASNVSEGIRNTTTVFDVPDRDRVRPPRHAPVDGVLVPYSAREALGQYWMRDLKDGAYRHDMYIAHIDSHDGDNVVLLTASALLSFRSRKLRLDWELPFSMVQGVTAEDTGILFSHKAGKVRDKFVFISDKQVQLWFFDEVASVVRVFNGRRRTEAESV